MNDYDEDELDAYLAEDHGPYLSRNAIRTGMVIAGAICISIGTGYLVGPGAGWLLMGIVAIMMVVVSGGEG